MHGYTYAYIKEYTYIASLNENFKPYIATQINIHTTKVDITLLKAMHKQNL